MAKVWQVMAVTGEAASSVTRSHRRRLEGEDIIGACQLVGEDIIGACQALGMEVYIRPLTSYLMRLRNTADGDSSGLLKEIDSEGEKGEPARGGGGVDRGGN
ncbi:hypothetical protein T484DRAFT_1817938 [Baffinella frigidus]|nr:hypothetical protein T484DRAFT_1817938 [Cryptophyta sp. CCMP2293]